MAGASCEKWTRVVGFLAYRMKMANQSQCICEQRMSCFAYCLSCLLYFFCISRQLESAAGGIPRPRFDILSPYRPVSFFIYCHGSFFGVSGPGDVRMISIIIIIIIIILFHLTLFLSSCSSFFFALVLGLHLFSAVPGLFSFHPSRCSLFVSFSFFFCPPQYFVRVCWSVNEKKKKEGRRRRRWRRSASRSSSHSLPSRALSQKKKKKKKRKISQSDSNDGGRDGEEHGKKNNGSGGTRSLVFEKKRTPDQKTKCVVHFH